MSLIVAPSLYNSLINDLSEKLKIYPNPAQQEIHIEIEGYEIQEAKIFNISGQLLIHELTNYELIDISALQSGMHIVEVMVDGRKIKRKLLVE